MALRIAAEKMTTLEAVQNSGCACIADLDDAEVDELIEVASDAIAIATAGIVAGRRTADVLPYVDLDAFLLGDSWPCNSPGIPLPGVDPVVVSVTIDGVALASNLYTVRTTSAASELHRISVDGNPPPPWPTSQQLWRNGVGDHTFVVRYTYGIHVDWMIQEAAIEMVCDLAVPTLDKKKSTMRPGVTSVSQGGVTVQVDNMVSRVRAGEVGPATSRMVGYYAPFGRAATNVWSPELSGGWTLQIKS